MCWHGKDRSRPVSRVLSSVTIHLGYASPHTSSGLPGSSCGHTRTLPYSALLLAGFAVPQRVTTCAVRSYRTFSPLPLKRRYVFCGTFRRLAPPRCYLVPCPGSPDFPLSWAQRLRSRLRTDSLPPCGGTASAASACAPWQPVAEPVVAAQVGQQCSARRSSAPSAGAFPARGQLRLRPRQTVYDVARQTRDPRTERCGLVRRQFLAQDRENAHRF